MNVIETRRAGSEDIRQIWLLLNQFAASYSPDERVFKSTFERLIESESVTFLVIEVDGAVLGYLLAFDLLTMFANGPIFNLVELVVDESYRGHGLGKRLVFDALALAWVRGCVEAVVPTRRAGKFYEKLGFSKSAEYLKLKRPLM